MRSLGRAHRFDKCTHKVLLLECDKLSSLLTRIKNHEEGIVEPRHLREDITSMMIEATTASANKDFINILSSISEAVVLQVGVAFALHLGENNWEYVLINNDSLDDLKTLEESTYNKLRRGSQNGNEGLGEFSQQVEENTFPAVMQPVVENPIVVLPSERSSRRWWLSEKKMPLPVIKRPKQ